MATSKEALLDIKKRIDKFFNSTEREQLQAAKLILTIEKIATEALLEDSPPEVKRELQKKNRERLKESMT